MRRAIARWQSWWLRLFVLAILVNLVLPAPFPLDLALMAVPFALSLIRPPVSDRGPVELAAPVRGCWVALNSPGTAVPSHGVKAYGQMYAVDLLQPSPDAAASIGWGLRARRPESYRSFGEPVRAMASGTVVQVQDSQRDHGARDTWPLLVYMMTVEGFLRELTGASRILGNHVIVEHDDGSSSTCPAPSPPTRTFVVVPPASVPGNEFLRGSSSVRSATPATPPSHTCTSSSWTGPTRRQPQVSPCTGRTCGSILPSSIAAGRPEPPNQQRSPGSSTTARSSTTDDAAVGGPVPRRPAMAGHRATPPSGAQLGSGRQPLPGWHAEARRPRMSPSRDHPVWLQALNELHPPPRR